MRLNGRLLGLVGAAAGLGAAGLAAQHEVVRRRQRSDPEADEPLGSRRGVRERMVKLNDGAEIFVTEAGPEARRGALFLHGSALRSDVWHYQMPGLGDHRLVFMDMRGHGRSVPKGTKKFVGRTLAEDVLAVVEDCDLEEVVVVGHSFGGMIALDLCREFPDHMGSVVKGLVVAHATYCHPVETLVGGAAIARLERIMRRPMDALAGHSHRLELLRKLIRPSDTLFMAVSFAAFGPHGSANQIDFTYDMLAETEIDVIFDLLKAYRSFDVTEHLESIDVPTLVIGGSRDRITIPGASEYLAAHLPNSRLTIYKDCGHSSMMERHERFNDDVLAFLDEVIGEQSSARFVAYGGQT